MRPKGSAAELEARRLHAASLVGEGVSIAEVARRFGVDRSSVKRWKRAMVGGGVEALAARPNLGRRPRLTDEQRAELARVMREGPRAAGFATDLWTLRRVAKVIRERFGAAYHVRYLGRLLKKLGFTRQKPAFRATQRDEVAISRWRTHDWPRIKKRLEDAARPSYSSTRPAFCSAR